MRNSTVACRLLGCFVGMHLFSVSAHAQNVLAFNAHNKTAYEKATEATYAFEQEDNTQKEKLFTVLKELNKTKGVYFLYSDDKLAGKLVNPIAEKQATVLKILDQVLKNTGLTYKKVSDDTFVIVPVSEAKTPQGQGTATENKENLSTYALNAYYAAITGKVIATNGNPLPNVSVLIKGTKKGVTTNSSGEFSIEATKGSTLVFSFIGFESKEIVVGSESTIDVVLNESQANLNEIVVTALGVKKERRAVGYSVTEVKGEELTKAREVNVMNSLVGKVAGLNVGSTTGGPGSTSNVVIRGVSSLTQTTQPLYVINGVPVEGSTRNAMNTGSQWDNAPDLGDAIGNINPDDIETISVLKGAAASALYGYRAKAGVIMITTKAGRGNEVEVNSNYVMDRIVNMTDWQYDYGQGANNIKPTTANAAFTSGQSSWGAKLDGSNVIQFDGVARPYIAQKKNLQNFYRTGGSFTNTIAFNRTFDGGAIRFSASDLTNRSVVPNSGLNRQTFNFTGTFTVLKRLAIDVRANYIMEQGKNRSFVSDGAGNANYNVTFLPTSLDVNTLKKATNPDGTEFAYSSNTYATNPWFAAEKFINDTKRERLISSANLRYTFDNGYFIQGRVGRDAYTNTYTGVVPTGTAYPAPVDITIQNTKYADLNIDGLAGKSFKAGSDWVITPNIGGSYRKTRSDMYNNSGTNFAVPYVYTITNAKNKSVVWAPYELETQSLYGNVEVSYKSFLYLNGSARSDWFSTLATPGKNNKLNIVYPSVSGSFIFTELTKPGFLSFGKLRAGYAVVGQAADPYQTQLSYTLNSASLNGLPIGAILNPAVPNSGLVASKASELEIGTELKFFNSRLGLDVTWYNKESKDEILSAPASITSGYVGAVLNIGKLRNRGVEALVTGKIISDKHFTWTSSLNGSVNNSKVISLADGLASLSLGTSRSGNGFVQDIPGMAANQIMAFDYKYDAAGKVVLDANGVPDRGDLKAWGPAYHKWIAGWNNEFTYKKFSLSFLIDGKFGGKIFSATDYYGYVFGLHKATLVNREGKFGSANLDAATYYTTFANNISKTFVQDASFIKFRQLMFSYSFTKLFGFVKGGSIGIVGRNLFYIMKKTDNIDPEANYNAAATGLELGGLPPVRSIGLNLNVKF